MLTPDTWHEQLRANPAPGFGSELASLLSQRGLSYLRAAQLMPCDHSYLSRLVSGKRMPTVSMIESIARALELTERERQRLSVLAGFVPDGMVPRLLAEIDRGVA